MKIYHTTEVLSAPCKTGTKYWRGEAATDPSGAAFTRAETWRDLDSGKESKHLLSEWSQVEATNEGRSNHRNPKEQAIFELAAQAEKKVKYGGYWPLGKTKPLAVVKDRTARPKPMLAKSLDDDSRKVKWPAYVQPKLDGVRMLADGKRAWARSTNPHIPECVEHLLFDTSGHILDGELMLPHDKWSFQQTIQAVKKFYPALSPQLEYHVYDIVDTDMTFEERFEVLKQLQEDFPPNVKLVVTQLVRDMEEVEAAHGTFVQAGYEGAMVRNRHGKYEVGGRSVNLLKFKKFVDDEFEIVHIQEGQGKRAGTAIFDCAINPQAAKRIRAELAKAESETEKATIIDKAKQRNEAFSANPEGTDAQREQMWRDRKNLVGRMLTVRYQNLSDEGIPRFPIGVAVRDYE